MTHRRFLPLLASILLFTGAGCSQLADQAAEQAVQPVAAPLKALDSSKKTLAQVQAGLNQEGAAADQDTVTVALVLTDGSQLPYGAVLGEEFGCGDRLAFTKIKRTADSGDQAADALAALLALKDTNANGLYDALAMSALKLDGIWRGADGTSDVLLTGQPQSGGVCDDPRIKNQVEATVRRFLTHYRVLLNGSEAKWRCFGDQSGLCK